MFVARDMEPSYELCPEGVVCYVRSSRSLEEMLKVGSGHGSAFPSQVVRGFSQQGSAKVISKSFARVYCVKVILC